MTRRLRRCPRTESRRCTLRWQSADRRQRGRQSSRASNPADPDTRDLQLQARHRTHFTREQTEMLNVKSVSDVYEKTAVWRPSSTLIIKAQYN